MKTHLELYGWQIKRFEGVFGPKKNWFNLYVKGTTLPYAGGPLDHIKKVIENL